MRTGIFDGGYIHDCRNSSDSKQLFSRQPFPMPKSLYTRLPCIKYKSVIYTAAISHTKRFIYTAAVHKVYQCYLHGSGFTCQKVFIHGCLSSSIKALFTWQPFSMQNFYIHCCRGSSMKWIHVFTRQSFLKHEIKQKKTARIACFLEIY